MSGIVEIAAIGAAVIYVIAGQVKGQLLQPKRLVVLPGVLIVVGLIGLAHMRGVGAADIACITATGLIAIAIGLGQGAVTRLETRGGALYGRLPVRGLWLWAALIGSRVLVMVAAHALGADAAASMDSILFVLGINRLAQAGVIVARAVRTGLLAGPDGASWGDTFGQNTRNVPPTRFGSRASRRY
jgi:hypothetical protein